LLALSKLTTHLRIIRIIAAETRVKIDTSLSLALDALTPITDLAYVSVTTITTSFKACPVVALSLRVSPTVISPADVYTGFILRAVANADNIARITSKDASLVIRALRDAILIGRTWLLAIAISSAARLTTTITVAEVTRFAIAIRYTDSTKVFALAAIAYVVLTFTIVIA